MTADGRRKAPEITTPASGKPSHTSPVAAEPVSGLRSPVSVPHRYKFQKLHVYQLALDYLDKVYETARGLPETEKYNLNSQIVRAATSIALNIAEGSTSQTDAEQSRFISMAQRSLLETVACLDIAERRQFSGSSDLQPVRDLGRELFAKLLALRRSLNPSVSGHRSSVS